ncbi:protein phosphatase 1F-like [Haliotis asinina]|uniref:protein phosphatase 1F-like n=1 Tax=Haliotis asinina TaxID=109174 RepID=UPI00353253C9
MEGSQRAELLSSFRKFLDKFCNEIDTTVTDEDDPPIRLIWDFVLTSEIEGECLYWVQQYLAQFECPSVLSCHIARAAYLRVTKLDVRPFYVEIDDDDDDDDDDDEDDDDEEEVSITENNGSRTSQNSETLIPHIDSRRLLKEVIRIVHDICRVWQQSFPALLLPQRSLQVCSYAIKNTRRKMEDKHVIMPDLNALFNLKDCPSQSYYAVFDGHGGVEAATYTASHLHCNFVHDKEFNSDVAKAIKNSYKLTDDWFLERAKRDKLRSGTTCVTALVQDSRIHISWLGDSQAVLVRNGGAVTLMNPHKPERPDEKERIEKLGGVVLHYGTWRVNGNIAVSRAIGDVSQKPYISSDAEVYSFDLDGKEDYLVLACDGAWDVLTFEDLPEIVYNHIQENHGDRSTVAHRLVNYARDNGSNDNISVIVVFLRDQISAPKTNNASIDRVRANGSEGKKRHGSGSDKSSRHSNGKGNLEPSLRNSNKQSKERMSKDHESRLTQEFHHPEDHMKLHLKENISTSDKGKQGSKSSQDWFWKSVHSFLTFLKLSNRDVSSESEDKNNMPHDSNTEKETALRSC